MGLNTAQELIEDISLGKMVILVDDEDRENEGDLVVSADYATPEVVNFMAIHARGLICLALTAEQIERLKLPLMVGEGSNLSPNQTAFTVSVEASMGVSTGISAADRALTIKVASSPASGPGDVIMPGHVFPIRARKGGVLRRAGHTEGSVDLVRMAGLNPAAAICEIMNEDGSMARLPELRKFAEEHKLKIGSIESLIQHRIQTESFVEKRMESTFQNEWDQDFRVQLWVNQLDGREHLSITKGEFEKNSVALIRVHTESVMGDVFGDLRSQSGKYLSEALRKISKSGCGALIYLRQEGQRLEQRLKSYDRAAGGPRDTHKMSDERDYGVGAQILRALGVSQANLLTNNPSKRVGLKGFGIEIVDTTPLTGED